MDVDVTKKHKYLGIRGSTYSIRVPVPIHLQKVLKRKEITRSLKTKDPVEANKLYPERLSEILKIFEISESKLDQSKPVTLIGFKPFPVVWDWFHVQRKQIKYTSGGAQNAESQNVREALKASLVELTSRNMERRFQYVEPTANKLLFESGYPANDKTGFPNVDTLDPRYRRLFELLVTAEVELSEYQLSCLGEHFSPTPNGNIFWESELKEDQEKNHGQTLEELIRDYMEVKGYIGRAKTANDKLAAFEYITRLVGLSFQVNKLTRDHFMQLRKILSAFPKNAQKQKVLKGKSLIEVSEYAQKHHLDLMSKQNANKIIARLHSLMEYGVATKTIEANPCKEIKFHITDAEKFTAEKRPFTMEQLQVLFSSPAFKNGYPLGPAMYWVPLIALFHGFRMEEILILTLDQVKHEKEFGIHYFDLTDFSTDTLKNKNAIRRVPFHPILQELGFHQYLSECIGNKGKRLFQELKRGKGVDQSYRKIFSPKFSRYLKKVGVYTEKTTFHAFRRNFDLACKAAKIPLDYENALSGWALLGGQKGNYIKHKDFDLVALSEELSKVSFPMLDLTHLFPLNKI